jgi:hypothetical protein
LLLNCFLYIFINVRLNHPHFIIKNLFLWDFLSGTCKQSLRIWQQTRKRAFGRCTELFGKEKTGNAAGIGEEELRNSREYRVTSILDKQPIASGRGRIDLVVLITNSLCYRFIQKINKAAATISFILKACGLPLFLFHKKLGSF